jgi:hypothetical protein
MTDTKRRSVVKGNVMVSDPSDPTSALLSGCAGGATREPRALTGKFACWRQFGQTGSQGV